MSTDPMASGAPWYTRWTGWREAALLCGLALLGVAVCASVAGVNIAKGWLLIVLIASAPQLLAAAPWRQPAMAAGLVLLLYIVGESIAHAGFKAAILDAVKHYQELLIAPLLFALLHRSARSQRVLLAALLAGAFAVASVHWYALAATHPPVLEARRISAGFMLAVTAFIALVLSAESDHPWWWRLLALVLALTTLFAVGGRTGHLVLLTLAMYTAWLFAPRRWRWIAPLTTAALLVGVAVFSDEVQHRLRETVAVATGGFASQELRATSTAIRIHMLQVSSDIVAQHGLVGVGYAGYGEAYRTALAQRMAHDPALYAHAPEIWTHSDNPHSEYLMHWLGGGLAGLLLFGLWLLVLVRQARALPARYRRIMTGLCVAFAVGCLFNSLLLDFTEGHFFVIVMVWALSAGLTARERDPL